MTRLAWTPVLLAGAAGLAAADEQRDSPRPLESVEIVEHLGAQVPPDLVFRDQAGTPVRLGDRFGKGRPILLVLSWYRCPMLCSLVLAGAARALPWGGPWRLGQDVDALTISFAPDEGPRDADERRRTHLTAMRAPLDSPEWPFLTGDRKGITALTEALGFRYSWDAATRQYAHPAALFVLTPEGRISRYLYGVQPAPRDLRLSLVEAADGRVGPSLDRVLLACYRYDAARRRYGLFLARFLQAGGLLVFVALAVVLGRLWRQELRPEVRGAGGRRKGIS